MVSEIVSGECDAVVDNDMTLIRPLNKGQGHSFCEWVSGRGVWWLTAAGGGVRQSAGSASVDDHYWHVLSRTSQDPCEREVPQFRHVDVVSAGTWSPAGGWWWRRRGDRTAHRGHHWPRPPTRLV